MKLHFKDGSDVVEGVSLPLQEDFLKKYTKSEKLTMHDVRIVAKKVFDSEYLEMQYSEIQYENETAFSLVLYEKTVGEGLKAANVKEGLKMFYKALDELIYNRSYKICEWEYVINNEVKI